MEGGIELLPRIANAWHDTRLPHRFPAALYRRWRVDRLMRRFEPPGE